MRLPLIRSLVLFASTTLALAVNIPTAHATSVEPPEFSQLVTRADYIIRGRVTSIHPEWREADGRRFIISKVQVEVLEIIRGTPPPQVVLEMIGGKIDDQELVVTGAPRFAVGDEDVLFVRGNGRLISPLVGIMHGRYPILADRKTGTRYAVRNNGMPLYSEADVGLSMETVSPVKRRDPTAQPITASAFIRKIREFNGAQAATTHAQ